MFLNVSGKRLVNQQQKGLQSEAITVYCCGEAMICPYAAISHNNFLLFVNCVGKDKLQFPHLVPTVIIRRFVVLFYPDVLVTELLAQVFQSAYRGGEVSQALPGQLP